MLIETHYKNSLGKVNRNYDFSDFHANLALIHKRLVKNLSVGSSTQGGREISVDTYSSLHT